MMIGKIQTDKENYKIHFHYYNCARDAMYDLVSNLAEQGFTEIYIPGYIGWSPKEGSGIFDPLEAISSICRHYYKMTRELWVDMKFFRENIHEHSLILVVNYFGFRDRNIRELIDIAHQKKCIVIEDNAHGFYTYFCKGSVGTDATFFSLHKMFPFENGGGLLIENKDIDINNLNDIKENVEDNPFIYNINAIAQARIHNFQLYTSLAKEKEEWFEPLRNIGDIEGNIPQSFPIIIKKGNRDEIYEIMNKAGFGVVSLYHTMIEELRNDENKDAIWLSRRVMNLPVHQDLNTKKLGDLIDVLKKACVSTQ